MGISSRLAIIGASRHPEGGQKPVSGSGIAVLEASEPEALQNWTKKKDGRTEDEGHLGHP
jgi:hypothetical protein